MHIQLILFHQHNHHIKLATFPAVAQSSHDHSSSTVAISSTGNHMLAESLKGKAAGEAFQKHRDDLRIAVTDPHILASSLYSNSIISRDSRSC